MIRDMGYRGYESPYDNLLDNKAFQLDIYFLEVT